MFGFLIVLLSSVVFCIQNVIVRVLFNKYSVFGIWQIGGYVTPTLQHSFLLLFMRMLLAVPLMALLVSQLHPSTWKEIQQLRRPEQRPLLLQSLGGGLLMFLYLALLYISLGMVPAGIAMALFFTYPVFTALFAWRWFGNRPSLLCWAVMGFVFLGSSLTMPHLSAATDRQSWIGIIAGVTSGVTYAMYTVVAQKSFEKLHPFPYTWISFATALVLSGISLLLWHNQETSIPWLPLWIGGLLSAIVTFSGHLMNNLGIGQIGATSASIIGATNPALTALLAWLTIQETLNGLQVFGVLIVTMSVALLSREAKTVK